MIKVTLPYDLEWTALDWAKIHCPDYITNSIHKLADATVADWNDWNQIDYFFSSERDAVFFKLKWAK
jgi:hypothetical protein